MYRRQFMKTLAIGAASASVIKNAWVSNALAATNGTTDLSISKRVLEVNGKAATVFGLGTADGKPGVVLNAGGDFNVNLLNQTEENTLIHWHGLTPPWGMDGVPDNPAKLLSSGESRHYLFPVGQGGTHWMHAHTLQEQTLLAAPLIVRTAGDLARDEQEVVILLHDFSFKTPEELLAGLKAPGSGGASAGHRGVVGHMGAVVQGMEGMHQQHMSGMAMQGMPAMDLNDIEYDAYLANDRTLDDPEVVTVEKGGRVRLRIINGATATAFTIDTGTLPGDLIAVDGNDVEPIAGGRFPISMGQRLDIRLQLPPGSGAFPIFALREGAKEQTGVILATANANISKVSTVAVDGGPVLDLALEEMLTAASPLDQRAPDRAYDLTLSGDMASYVWEIGSADGPMKVATGNRVELVMRNMSMMAHPMHLHGHHFQVVGINGKRINGAVRDTVLVPPMAEVSVQFDASNTGRWPFHCHHLYHMATGMMSFVTYDDAI
ncbi:FtsP/CotA-like multicopper oxidase with cupredoxin domain [Rhizobium subbaraonis]|uniref:FtsP/CotA-like multicopper oxidase with cupredoxin domain n=1 Tax=Rhizobium subbaraonis TaxID=908946 RepID=A0A285U125_9HYPH|nr:multicopper oxidase domain-containing protein [Rhizobium subbaraonis]SOC35660.1 FtsP/CotA-like multicopper oxidase with cupredoxin domain [Rhizobium subbaraonis]